MNTGTPAASAKAASAVRGVVPVHAAARHHHRAARRPASSSASRAIAAGSPAAGVRCT